MKRKAAISAEAQMSELVSAPQSRAAAVKKSQSKGKKVKKVKVTVRKDFATEVEEDGNRQLPDNSKDGENREVQPKVVVAVHTSTEEINNTTMTITDSGRMSSDNFTTTTSKLGLRPAISSNCRVMLMEPLDAILSTTVSVTPQYDPSVSVMDTNVVDVIAEELFKEDEDKENNDEPVCGFTDAEIRRFIKSYKKFPMPLTRMDDIGEDAKLADKAVSDLVDLGRLLRQKCMEALEDQETDSRKKVEAVKLGKVSVNPKTLIESESLLRPLGRIMPTKTEDRKSWSLDLHLKDAHFDVAWGKDEDSSLLVGIFLYGLGSWEQIKSDKTLDLSGKILLNASCKPQEKHLDVRAAYLLRSLKKLKDGEEKPPAPKKKEKKETSAIIREPIVEEENKVFKSKEIIEDDDSSDDDKKKKDKKSKKKDVKEKKKEKSKGPSGPVHIGSGDQLTLKSDLDSETFSQCKDKMRAVKKSLKALDKPDPNQTAEEQVGFII